MNRRTHHCDQRPPESERYGIEVVIGVILNSFGIIDQRGEYHNAENQEEHQEKQLAGAGFEGLYENFESGRMPGQFEESHNTNDRKKFQYIGIVQALDELTKWGEWKGVGLVGCLFGENFNWIVFDLIDFDVFLLLTMLLNK